MNLRALPAVALVLAGCTVGPDYRRPELPVPPEFRGQPADVPVGPPSIADLGWWQLFEDETLHGLLRTALAENYDVRVAAARVLDARSQVTVRRSLQFPDVGASASAPYVNIAGDLAPLQLDESFSPLATLDLFWELDFWGRLRRATQAARADLLASVEAETAGWGAGERAAKGD